ncbi:MAG: 3-hydroxyacyl-CoA dehydrogenase family protein [Actinobacteria bacterium]|nr:3-hydroxyacyl-CoA dehydrogenase family protein [Actinomycetota bacterium]
MDSESKSKIAIVGAGYMGGGMAQVFALNGHPVSIFDLDTETTKMSFDRLIIESRSFEELGLFAPGSAEIISRNLSCGKNIEEVVAGADYIAEAVPEVIQIKNEVLTKISIAAKDDAIIASNTSAIPISKLSVFVTNPGRFLGVHWVNPAPFIPGVEIIPTAETSEEVLQYVEVLIGSLGKVTSRVSDVAGFIINRLQFALYKEAVTMFEEGVGTPQEIDAIVSNTFGFRLALFGPFAIADMAGLDVFVGAYKSLAEAYGERFAAPDSLAEKVKNGDFGLKTCGGFAGLDASKKDEIVAYRNRAYAALSQLKKDLGTPPGFPD